MLTGPVAPSRSQRLPVFVCIRRDIGQRSASLAKTEGAGLAVSIQARRDAARVVVGRQERVAGEQTLGLVGAQHFNGHDVSGRTAAA